MAAFSARYRLPVLSTMPARWQDARRRLLGLLTGGDPRPVLVQLSSSAPGDEAAGPADNDPTSLDHLLRRAAARRRGPEPEPEERAPAPGSDDADDPERLSD